jgi:hypothetical protein
MKPTNDTSVRCIVTPQNLQRTILEMDNLHAEETRHSSAWHLGHSAKCREFGILQKNFKNRTGFHQVRFHCLASLSGKIGNYRGWLASREKSGIIGIPIFPDNYQ